MSKPVILPKSIIAVGVVCSILGGAILRDVSVSDLPSPSVPVVVGPPTQAATPAENTQRVYEIEQALGINTDHVPDTGKLVKPAPIPIAPPTKKGLDLHWTGDWYYLGNWPMGHVIRSGTFDYMSGQNVPPFLFIGVCGDEQTGLVTEGEARKFVEAGTKGNLQDGGIAP